MTRSARLSYLRLFVGALATGALATPWSGLGAQPAPASNRIALVIGESAYKSGPLSSAANDAGLVADTLRLAGFDVTGAADLDQDGLRRAMKEFVDKAAAVGPNGIVFVYLSGRALQYAGENYFVPVEATIPRASGVPLETVRISDYTKPLAELPLKARIIVVDGARTNSFAQTGAPLAGGLALVEPEPGTLYAFNAAPGSVMGNETGPYGAYAQALTEMLREGGLPLDEAFARTRLRVSELTKGEEVPWDESKLAPAPALFARAPGAPAPAVALEAQANMRARPIRDFPVAEAFAAALERDTISGYQDFLNAYPNTKIGARVRAMLALRREALTWRRAYQANTPDSYWSYLQRYRRGPHAEDARRRLGLLSAALEPPPRFDVYEFDVPPPDEQEFVYIDRPYVVFDDADYGEPPMMEMILPPRPYYIEQAPPPPPYAGLLPIPLIAAPLLFALPAVRAGVFHAPAAVMAQQPGANDYYRNSTAQQQPAPSSPAAGSGAPGAGFGGARPAAPQPGAGTPAAPSAQAPAAQTTAPTTGAAPNGRPLPHGAPSATAPATTAPASQTPGQVAAPNGRPLPHGAPVANAPAAAPVTAAPAVKAASGPGQGAGNRPHAPKTPPVPVATAPAAQSPVVHAPVAHAPTPHAPAPHVAAPPQPVVARPAAPKPVAQAPRPAAPPHVAAPAPQRVAAPQPPHPAPPPPKPAPPHAPPPGGHPHCGAPGEPACH